MSSTDKPEISKQWWMSEKPDDIKGQDLKKALAAAEKALAAAEKKGDAKSIDECLAALASLSTATSKTIKKECDRKKHEDVIDVLESLEELIEEEVERLEEAKAELGEDDEEEKGIFKEEYLGRMIKQLRAGSELHFCFGLNKSEPEASRLLLCNKRKPERLHKALKGTGEFSNRLMTFGSCVGDGKTLEFRLADDAKEPSQIVKLCKEYLKGNPELKYKKIRVLAGGKAFEEELSNRRDSGGRSKAGARTS